MIEDCPFEDLHETQKFEELSEAMLMGVLQEIKDSGEKVLLIMDDVVNDMKKEHLRRRTARSTALAPYFQPRQR